MDGLGLGEQRETKYAQHVALLYLVSPVCSMCTDISSSVPYLVQARTAAVPVAVATVIMTAALLALTWVSARGTTLGENGD